MKKSFDARVEIALMVERYAAAMSPPSRAVPAAGCEKPRSVELMSADRCRRNRVFLHVPTVHGILHTLHDLLHGRQRVFFYHVSSDGGLIRTVGSCKCRWFHLTRCSLPKL